MADTRPIDAGYAQPVTECPGSDFRVPDSPWPCLGNDDSSAAWEGIWDDVDTRFPGVADKVRRPERLRVKYDVYAKVANALNKRIDKLFDSDSDWASDVMQVKLPNIIGIVAHLPTVFHDLLTKVDRNAPPDFRDWPLPSGESLHSGQVWSVRPRSQRDLACRSANNPTTPP
jgi:hypothetical protein